MKIKKISAAFKVIRIMKNWPDYFMETWGFNKKDKLIYKLRNGIELRLKYSILNRKIFNEIWIYESYNPKGFEIKLGDIVLDIGANYGNFSIYAGNKTKNGKVYAFEPATENFDILKENIEKNNMKNVFPIQGGVSDKTGIKKIFLNENSPASNSFFEEIARSEELKVEKIKTIAFKDFILKNKIRKINFLKLDCEGAEYEILFSIKDFLRKVDKISGEIHYLDEKRNVLNIKRFLEENGFEVNIKPEYETKFVNLLYAKRKW